MAERNSQWIYFIPTVTSQGGSLGTLTAGGRYLVKDKVVFLEIGIDIQGVGTATGDGFVDLPYEMPPLNTESWPSLSNSNRSLYGKFGNLSLCAELGFYITTPNINRILFRKYDGTTVFTAPVFVVIDGFYGTA